MLELTPSEEAQSKAKIIVIGAGGAGNNAINRMVDANMDQEVTLIGVNTDEQALSLCKAPTVLQIGAKLTKGLGAGAHPEIGEKAAEESQEDIAAAIKGANMVFVTCGMGGGTGTGASAVIAEEAQKLGILTVGIVTIPFAFEGKKKILKAMTGVAALAQHVDALLIINNEKLVKIYPDFTILNAFQKSDEVVSNAAKAIAEIITVPGYINTDFADVRNTLKNGNVAIMNVGQAGGENRITKAIENALNSPLANANDVRGAKRVLLQFYCSTEHAILMDEFEQINQFVKEVGDDVEVQWGASLDETLGEEVRVTIIATGYEVSDIPVMEGEGTSIDEAIQQNYPPQEPQPVLQPVQPKVVQPAQPEPFVQPVVQQPVQPQPMQQPTVRPVQPTQPVQPVYSDDIIIDDEPVRITDPSSMPTPQFTNPSTPSWMRGRK